MGKQQPIGIFDSGVGGTSIWREIHSLLPMEQTLYLADSANAPYGEKSKQEIIDLSVKNTRKLLEMDSKIIVVACKPGSLVSSQPGERFQVSSSPKPLTFIHNMPK